MAKPSLQSIQEQIKKLQAKAEVLKARNKKPALASIVNLMRENDISVEEINSALGKRGRLNGAEKKKAGAKAAGRPVAIKYRNPATNETWTGRGKTPRWLVEAEAAGKDRKEFAV